MDRPSADVQLELARREQSPILANLLELYAHDFSEFQPLDIGPEGRFGYKSLPLYWSESNRHPFPAQMLIPIADLRSSPLDAPTETRGDTSERRNGRAHPRQSSIRQRDDRRRHNGRQRVRAPL